MSMAATGKSDTSPAQSSLAEAVTPLTPADDAAAAPGRSKMAALLTMSLKQRQSF